jgi:hypothetical protein
MVDPGGTNDKGYPGVGMAFGEKINTDKVVLERKGV